MCGICGLFSFDGSPVDSTELKSMVESLRHRGPDSEGLHIDGRVGIGVRRLSIIDLKTGDQPIHNEDSSIWIVFNGEIYNYKRLREKAIDNGHRFYTQTDTEVIVHLYETYGENAIQMLDGMYAICIWDGRKRRVLLARDRFGEKPLYYARTRNELIFASEPKAILAVPRYSPRVDLHSLEAYLVLGYVPSPMAIYEGMRKLCPGQLITVESDGHYASTSMSREVNSTPGTLGDSIKRSALIGLKMGVESRQVSDVPVGVLLSGGVDSGLVDSFMCELGNLQAMSAFTLGFEDPKYDESEFALEVAEHLGIKTTLKKFAESEVVSYASKVLDLLDEPIADPSIIPTYIVSLVASREVKVVLTGDGGDELFGGYPKYRVQRWLGFYDGLPSPLRRLVAWPLGRLPEKLVGAKAKRVFSTLGYDAAERNMLWVSPFLPCELPELLLAPTDFALDELELPRAGEGRSSPAEVAMDNDRRYALGDLFLQKVDRASMMCSLESRSPFLSPNVVLLARRLPIRCKVGLSGNKVLLKEVALERLPRRAVLRKKQGFGIPVASLLRGPLKESVLSTLSRDRIERASLFSYQYVQRLVGQHLAGEKDNSAKIWALYVFQIWYERWIKGMAAD